MRKIFIGAFLLLALACFSQRQDSVKSEPWKNIYRASPTKINDLVHTKLDVSFDFSRSWMYGKAWITLHPHFYDTDSLNLDAKNMKINEVSVVKEGKHIPLKYRYDSLNLHITLDKTYRGGENYIVFINYVAIPDESKGKGSSAITSAQGLYFINPLGKDKNKPTQIWTQGETESNSVWFPTIDRPNQKTTDEISITVPDKYLTLSNGLLVSHRKHSDGMRTDTWKMDLPHAPYLMMMAVGEFSVIKDSYKGKEVSYYVEKEYAPVARKIFGLTPEMIGYFSRITGVNYPWQKYAQVVVRDYVSGAMENTTATVHGSSAQQDARQLLDGNSVEDMISHELFHQWFGDYVTTESWSNLTVNESFADLSEVLWEEYKYGKDAGDSHNYNSMQQYLYSNSAKLDLVRFYYNSREDVFDFVSYQKGGRILNMLRNYVGDSAFFKSLNLILTTKKFNTAEAQDIRLAFEEVTGQDLNWFWNQWFYGSGHPKLDITYDYDATGKTAKVIISQTQEGKAFKVPLAIDVYQGSEKKRYKVWLENKADTFTFPVSSKPDLINVDGDKILLCEKTDHKTMDNFTFQYSNAGLYLDRREAVDYAAKKRSEDPRSYEILKNALKDRYYGLRIYALRVLNNPGDSMMKSVEPLIVDMAGNDPKPLVRATAIESLGRFKKQIYKPLFLKSIGDSSYTIAGKALLALGATDSASALDRVRIISKQHVGGALSDAINYVLFMYSGENDFDSLAAKFDILPFWYEKLMMLQPFTSFMKRVKNGDNFIKGIDMIVKFRDTIPKEFRQQLEPYFNARSLNSIAQSKESQGMTEQADYVKSKLPVKAKAPGALILNREELQKFEGEYDIKGAMVKIILKDNNTLSIVFPGQPEMELTPLSKTRFALKYVEGYNVEFISNDKGEVTDLMLNSPGEQIKASRKK